MEPGGTQKSNQTLVTEFLLQGFSEHPALRLPLISCFLVLYTVAFIGNTLIVAVVGFSACLHRPMYFFLSNLATMDIICTSTILPKVLVGLIVQDNTISYMGCMVQLFFLIWSASSELLLLSVMAFDRYVAICRPLHYGSIMSPRVCTALAGGVWAICALNASINTSLMVQLTFCGPHIIAHFFCEIPPLLLLSCSPTWVNSIMTVLADGFYGFTNFMLTLTSYGCIVTSILRISSAEGKRRAFSTCSSHLMVVCVYYTAVFYAYISPASSYIPERSKVAGVLYTVVSPTLNPLIYTLRNAEVHRALGKFLPFCRR
ncbi:PREDICTED: olfactory receptor 13A1-like [Elephantulus edwardii]|uniref:olfactory receptor 13A1-like n=1 Tax=Elephantulus edwardii TaxID=28737 RepID=UPI0003F0B428|nr:PREDICTED: olfactory receptor 13A1-like [Elephantulus edwardii]